MSDLGLMTLLQMENHTQIVIRRYASVECPTIPQMTVSLLIFRMLRIIINMTMRQYNVAWYEPNNEE